MILYELKFIGGKRVFNAGRFDNEEHARQELVKLSKVMSDRLGKGRWIVKRVIEEEAETCA